MTRRILLAEDQMVTRESLVNHAVRYGYEVVAVDNGVDLLSAASKDKFDVVITDLVMPDLNGAAATEIMKLQGHTIPIIALTGLSSKDIDRVESKFTKVFHKPVDVKGLFTYLEQLFAE